MTKKKHGWKFRHGSHSYRVVFVHPARYMLSPWREDLRKAAYCVIDFFVETSPDFALTFDFRAYAPQLAGDARHVTGLTTLPEALAAGAMLIERIQALPEGD